MDILTIICIFTMVFFAVAFLIADNADRERREREVMRIRRDCRREILKLQKELDMYRQFR